MNTKITKCCSITPSRRALLGNLPEHSRFLLPPQHPSCTIPCNSKQKQTKVLPVTAAFSQCTCAQNHSLQRNFKPELPTCIMQYFWTRIVSGILQRSGILTIMCFFTTHTMKIPSHFKLSCQACTSITLNVLMTHFCKAKPTCNDVMDALWPCRTAKGAQVRRHQTRIILSQLPAAIMVFS